MVRLWNRFNERGILPTTGALLLIHRVFAMHPLIQDNLEGIRALARDYGVLRLEVFGSVCTDAFDPDRSDVDFLVEYPENYEFGPWLARFFTLQEALSCLLGREVDLVMTAALNNRWFQREAAKTRQVIFDGSKIPAVA